MLVPVEKRFVNDPATLDATDQRPSILVIDDHEATLTTLRVLLGRQGWDVTTASCGRDGLDAITAAPPDLALVDLNMDDLDGLTVLTQLRERSPKLLPCLMMSAENSVPAAVEAMRLGARDFLVKPLDPRLLVERVREALGSSTRADGRDPRAAWRDLHAPGIVGEDPRLLEVFHMLERIAPTDCTVLIQGESGTGKELVARALHAASNRRDGPFVPVNCAAIPETLIESELFGHSRGAFSGATHTREGRFAAADGGTLFLDEIGEMSPAAQAKLLRVLQDGEFVPVGETRPRRVDVRIVTATNRDLSAMAERGRFREDLFYRLHQIPLRLPSLRERVEDIPRLAEHFLERATARLGREVEGFSVAALQRLREYQWPGNVRELENAIERVVLLHADGGLVDVRSLPPPITSGVRAEPASTDIRSTLLELPADGVDLRGLLAKIEFELIDQALARTAGNKSRAARLLGLNRTTLVEKLRRSREE
jgi:DNA-binding NtrC family response regulator